MQAADAHEEFVARKAMHPVASGDSMDVERARAVAQVAGVLVDSAKVEVDYIKATGAAGDSLFISPLNSDPERLLSGSNGTIEKTPTGFVHRLKG